MNHEVMPVPQMEANGLSVADWHAHCRTCNLDGPPRQHRTLAAHDADRHRTTGDEFPEQRPGALW